MGPCDDLVKEFPCLHSLPNLAILRIDQGDRLIFFYRLHKGVRHANRYVKVRDGVLAILATDELLNVGVIHLQHGHVGAPSRPSLADDSRGDVKDAHKTHRACGLPPAAAYPGSPGAQPGEGKPRSPAGLLDQRCVAQRLKDAVLLAPHVVGDGKHKAGRQLPQRCPCTCKSWRVGHKAEAGQEVVKDRRGFFYIFSPRRFSSSDVGSHAVKHLLDRLYRLAVWPLAQVTVL
jgi:hypothetical protein